MSPSSTLSLRARCVRRLLRPPRNASRNLKAFQPRRSFSLSFSLCLSLSLSLAFEVLGMSAGSCLSKRASKVLPRQNLHVFCIQIEGSALKLEELALHSREGYESRRRPRDTYPESYIAKYTSIRRKLGCFALRLRAAGILREKGLYFQPDGPNSLYHRDDLVDRPRAMGV